jgi:hypothetical protein
VARALGLGEAEVAGDWLRWSGLVSAGAVEVVLAGGHDVVKLLDGGQLEAAAVRLVATYREPLRFGLAVVHTGRRTDAVRATGFDELDAAFTITSERPDEVRALLDDAALRGAIRGLLAQRKLQVTLRQVSIEVVVRDLTHVNDLVRAAIDVAGRLGARASQLGFTIPG